MVAALRNRAHTVIRRGDERFHFSDGSHKWIPPDPDYDQEAWDAMVRQHQLQHVEEISRRRRSRQQSEGQG
ncbi:hypothetical protein [Micromonospora sp. ATA51]|uniref:hypothetical protein n=1 Tax=Micromonospora sp. ATA51 TaxID=2806098 RepID=UPI001A6239CA|nr:hypothetical protein [Micromonospora sp. ATA51]MBM0227367.1 hypothetical protein [Micromonospora sp. ATA51]